MTYVELDAIARDWMRQRDTGVSVDALWSQLEKMHQSHRDYGVLCMALEAWAGPPSWKQR